MATNFTSAGRHHRHRVLRPEPRRPSRPGTAATTEYTLGRKCTALRATYALTDSSATGSSGAVTVTADGKQVAAHSLAVGTIVADEELDLTGVFRLKLDASTSATPAATAAVATPEVLCTR